MKTTVSSFDISEYLTDNKSIAAYLTSIMEENDTQLLLAAIGDIAKAKGMSKIASESGLGRESLYKALNFNATPRFDTVLKVLEALGVHLSFSPKDNETNTEYKRVTKKRVGRNATVTKNAH